MGELEWQSEDLDFPQPDSLTAIDRASLPMKQILRINALLKDRSFDVAIDFGPYGVFFANALAAEETIRRYVRIPKRLRVQIEWLCKASYAFVDSERRLINTLDDARLLRHFLTVKVPISLLANRRALERDLRRFESRLLYDRPLNT
jgi:hypothetical protein